MYGPRNAPPPSFPPLGVKPIPPLGNIAVQTEPPPGYRGRFDGPPFEDVPPGVEPPVPGFEPSPFEKPSFGPPGPVERDRIPPSGYRDPYRPPPYVEGPAGYRDMPVPPVQNEIPVHIPDHPPRYRDNYRPGHPYRDQGPIQFREGQPYRESGPQGPYRDNFRGGPPPPFRDGSYRNVPYREGNFREGVPPHNFREPGAPYRPPSADPREPIPPNYHDSNYRDGYRDENNPAREMMRSGYRTNIRNRGGNRRNPNIEHERHREKEGRERERFNENREPPPERVERPRDLEKRQVYEKSREVRDERPREYERNRDYDKEKERALEKGTPDKKGRVSSPKRMRDAREKKRSVSRGRSRDRDRESRREKKDDRVRDRTSTERSRDHKDKEKEKKIKDRKKKKREKEKDSEKKRKRDKKEKRDKESIKKESDDIEKPQSNPKLKEIKDEIKEDKTIKNNELEKEHSEVEADRVKTETNVVKQNDGLYGDEAAEAVDKEIIQNYVKADGNDEAKEEEKVTESSNKDEPFDGIELQAATEDLEADIEATIQNKEMLAPLPELSKWEVEDDTVEKSKEPGEITSPEEEGDGGKVTSEVIKRAENAIFAKAINSLRPIEIKKISSDRVKLYGDEAQQKSSMNNIQITVPVTDSEQRSIELNDRKRRYSKTPPPRLSVKERLGGKVEDVRRTRETRVVHSTVERVKSRSKTPKKEMYRRVTVERERGRKIDPHSRMDASKSDKRIGADDVRNEDSRSNDYKKREYDRNSKHEKKSFGDDKFATRGYGHDKNQPPEVKGGAIEHERKKSILDEAHFEPDYDETVESDSEIKEDGIKKRERSPSAGPNDSKKAKLEETIKLDLTNVKKKPDTDSESSSDSDASSSSSSSDARRRKKKKKRNKKKKKRAASDSDSDSGSSSDDHKKKKKKRKHKKKSSKKKKKSKHK